MKWIVGGTCLILAAVVELVSTAASVDLSGSPQHVLAAVAASPTGVQIESYLGVLLPVLLVPGVLPTLFLIAPKGRNFLYVGACLFLIGGIGHAIVGVATLGLLGLTQGSLSRDQVAPLVQPVANGALAVGLPLLLLAFVGGLVWLIGLVRAKWAPIWVLVVYLLWFVVESPLGKPITSTHTGLLVSEVLFAVAFAWLGILMLQQRSSGAAAGPA